jgi:signal transduction histidine kinase/CheY-like chemotaxis protein
VTPRLLALAIATERDVVLARQRARQIAAAVGFDLQDQTRIATAVSEIARNAFDYATAGRVTFELDGTSAPQVLVIHVCDDGPGIRDLPLILAGRYRSPTGMGIGMTGAQRLMDRFEVVAEPGRGTRVTMTKLLPRRAPYLGAEALRRIADDLARATPHDALAEIQRQNQELLHALDELTQRRDELATLNRELEDTNRGVVALYAELDERADHLRRADELKSRFLSNMSHEFRTPVNSIQALARMLLERMDGDLTPEQERQVLFIRKSADALSELVNDLLDLAKAEAGKIVIRPADFDVPGLFGALRGMLRPLLLNESVTLVFDEPDALPVLHTDEAKVSQILRNFVSNALKFTEQGEVRVSAEALAGGTQVAFHVRDTGIGVAHEDQERIFQEFTQIDSPQQRRVRGTGLGLPLCRKLAELLGGSVSLTSAPGSGSRFTAVIPTVWPGAAPGAAEAWEPQVGRVPILVVEDDVEQTLVYERYLAESDWQVVAARSVREARDRLDQVTPRAVVLDILLAGEDAWTFLTELKRRPATRAVPVLVISTVDDERKALALGADAYCAKPVDRQVLVQTLGRLTTPPRLRRQVLVVDDEEISRYLLRQHLATPLLVVSEAASGTEALERAGREQPDVICLDLGMPDLDGEEVLRRLKADPTTAAIPVVIVSARALDDAARRRLLLRAEAVLSKENLSRDAALATVTAALAAGEPAT